MLVFIEVKTRLMKKDEYILPEENISPKKLQSIEKIATLYLTMKHIRDKEYRFDAVSILLDPYTRKAKIRHLENIFF